MEVGEKAIQSDGAPEPPRQPVGVIVLGAARSGTSAITRALVAGGFFAGSNADLLGPSVSNEAGHYELLSVLELNEQILERFGCGSWADAPTAEAQIWHRAEAIPHLEAVVDGLIAAAGGAPVVIKDPRINGLLPLWQPVIEASLHPVLAIRDPLEVALSHAARDEISIGHALALWEVQVTSALQWLDGRVVTVAPYADLNSDPANAAELLRGIATHLDPSRAERVRPADAPAALRADLKRQHGDTLERRDHMTGRQEELWRFLGELPAGDTRLDVDAPLRGSAGAARAVLRREAERSERTAAQAAALERAEERATELEQRFAGATALAQQAVSASAERAERAAAAAAEAEQRCARAEAELARMRGARSWRLTGPLRRLGRALRPRSGT